MVSTATSSAWPAAGLVMFFIAWFVFVLATVAMMVVAIVDIARRPDWQWKLAGQDKVLWLLLVILVNVLAIPSLIYWFSVRKKLVAVEIAAKAGQFGPGQTTYAGWAPSMPEPAIVPNTPPGWHADPYAQHELRWWGGTYWTEHTWDNRSTTP